MASQMCGPHLKEVFMVLETQLQEKNILLCGSDYKLEATGSGEGDKILFPILTINVRKFNSLDKMTCYSEGHFTNVFQTTA